MSEKCDILFATIRMPEMPGAGLQNETRILATECKKDTGRYWQDAGTETGVRDSERDKEVFEMRIWFTLTGTCHYFGQDFLEKGMKIRLEKEPDNKYDREAIKVLIRDEEDSCSSADLCTSVLSFFHSIDGRRSFRDYKRCGQ